MLIEFDELVRKRRELKAWWANSQLTDCISHNSYSLRVDVQVTMLAYCGQEYAGARNYHDAPKFFVDSVRQEMQSEAKKIACQAYEKEIARLDAEIEKHRAFVLSQLNSNQ